ncbi:hypothetical protein SmJEL517_g04222 [Synchytrium microbalum]|uniref:Actin-crosslinking protein n=1 Tax=Synchytrium microbalum TaxID=1806994 RepID=A0A507BSX7_9FUNG|nr:uncharacterized protein SmJEL517_g04222 [Synchytrium microbalum]TPX32690.1 hypothetical protein SmJEL517_g04222 [Synchytrium microbalum]
MSGLKPNRLKFKGEAPVGIKKKRKADNPDHPKSSSSSSSKPPPSSDKAADPNAAWILAETEDDLLGPIFIISSTTTPPSVITSNAKFQTHLSMLEQQDDDTKDITLQSSTPYDVSQVFVCNKVAGSSKITLKSAYGRYLAADKFGIVSSESEAAGQQEEWEVLLRPDGIAFKSFYGTYLSAEYDKLEQDILDEEDDEHVDVKTKKQSLVKKSTSKKKQGVVRCDVDAVGFREVWKVKVQAAERSKRRKTKEDDVKKDLAASEAEDMKRFQSWNKHRPGVVSDVGLLKQAEREGNLHEVLVMRREKLKSDKFCK